MHLLVLQLLSLILNVWGAPQTVAPPPSANAQAGLSGKIVDRLGCPLMAKLTLRHGRDPLDGPLQEVQSNMDGQFTFADVPAGRYWLDYALKPGGTGGDGVLVTDAGTYKEIHWSLTPDRRTWDMNVVVTDSDGTALAGAAVVWRRFSGAGDGPSCETATALTDVDGRSQGSGLPSGTYRVVVTANGFVPQTRDITIGFAQKRTLTLRLLTPVEAERRARTVWEACSPYESPDPDTLPGLVSGSDAIVVGRIRTALLDPDYTAPEAHPVVLTRYDVDVADVIKPHPHLATTAQHVALLQSAGELDWGKDVFVGCSQKTMRPGEMYVLFLTWREPFQVFMPLRGTALLVDITNDSVAPFRVLDAPAAIIAAHTGQYASDFIRDIRAAIRGSR